MPKENQDELNKEISKITLKIRKEYPELIKYLDEIPVNFSFNLEDGVNKKEMQEYLNSLNNLISTYSQEHKKTKK
jgi:hypothetical protein